ncbi:glycosyl hydrolase family 28-related protein [Pseudonocardia sp. HH130630-07]|uniref:glycosyl hydrolase family 28-related protein n=1 Tax=Pseudonocardia sp. HH130630-07 TaxID=1690815 RepID=UPI0012EA12F3|nr:glycosyl hydrolase family 28-related protein [Pseudonocardia sp. HH130630-07]
MHVPFDRRRFLAIAGGLAVSGAAAAPAGAPSGPRVPAPEPGPARSTSAALWEEYLGAPDTHPTLPNVSFAGYRRGEQDLPAPGPVFDVRDHGATGDGAADDTDALLAAIEAAGAAGGGCVSLPAGTYRTTRLIPVHHSGVVLRGAGKDRTTLYCDRSLSEAYFENRRDTRIQWSFMGGLLWFVPRTRLDSLRAADFLGEEGWEGGAVLSTVPGGPRRGDSTLRVADASGLAAGDTVLLTLDNIEDSSLLRHLCGDVPDTADYDWTTAARRLRPELSDWSGAPNFTRYRWPVEIRAVDGDTVTLAQPLRLDLRAEWNPALCEIGPVVRGSGVEELTIRMREVELGPHNQEVGYNGPCFHNAIDCWARNVHVEHADNAFGMVSAKNVTLTGVSTGGRTAHHPFFCRVQSHDNLVSDFAVLGDCVHGLNSEGFSTGNVWSDGTMTAGTFDSHRAIPADSVRTGITLANTGRMGGSDDAGPLWGARISMWNVDVRNGRGHGVRIERNAPRSAVVGVRGTAEDAVTDHTREFGDDLGSVLADPGTVPEPVNLYRAQLAHRLGR